MLSSLASVLLLGVVSPGHGSAVKPLPGIETVSIARPNELTREIKIQGLSASGVMLLDIESGEELFSIAPDTRRPMASLTKLMTAIVTLEQVGLKRTLTVPPVASDMRGSTIGLETGDNMSVQNLLHALLIPSANDAAYTLATGVRGGVAGFVKAMNDRARTLGLTNTHFTNPAGLDSTEQYSTPRDLTWLSLAALRHSPIREIVSKRSARIVSSSGKDFSLRNTNELLHYNEDVFGMKTGTTDGAGECLIVLFRESGRDYLAVLLNSSNRYTDSLAILTAVHEAVR